MRKSLLAAMALLAPAWLAAQYREPARAWLPPLMGDPLKLSPDRFVADEYPAIARDRAGRVWVAWSSCRPASTGLPQDEDHLEAWQWPDDGQDVVVARWFDGKDWSDEQVVSAVPGVNYKPSVVTDGDGVRILWTARRDGRWKAFERRWQAGKWEAETAIAGSEDSLTIEARALDDGTLLAVTQKMAAPRIGLQARLFRNGQWQPPQTLDEGQGRCHRSSLLALPGGGWMVAWDEERGGNYEIYTRSSGGAIQRITESDLWDTTPTLARTPEGRIWLAWERKETVGGRFAYQGRSIFAKFFDGSRWQWAPSPFSGSEPGRLTRHSRFWATHGISEERYPQLLARANGELWLFWLGGGRMSSTSFTARVWKSGQWSEPRMIFHDAVPYSAFALPSARKGVDYRATARGPYQTPLCNQMVLALDDAAGSLWMAYEVPKRRHITDRASSEEVQPRPAGYGSDIYAHRLDIDEREYRLPRVVDEQTPIAALRTRPYSKVAPRKLELDGQTYQLVFGDLHGHTENDAIGTVDMYYAHGLLVTGADFIASTNHDYTPDFLTQSEWAGIQALAAVYNAIPERVAFPGWEWTTAPADLRGGHRAMYFLRDNGPLYRSTTVPSNSVAKLFQLLRGVDVILQPHHRNWEGYDPVLQPVFEIISAWREQRVEGSGFKPAGKVASAWEALERGYRIGFVGSGDTHWLGPGEDYGLTGAWVKELSRQGLFEAIRSRRVFASTGTKMMLDVRVNGKPMGGELKSAGPIRLDLEIMGDNGLDKIEIVRDHKVIHAVSGSGARLSLRYVDQSGRPEGRQSSYYYVKVTQKDAMQAWSSPVWVDWN